MAAANGGVNALTGHASQKYTHRHWIAERYSVIRNNYITTAGGHERPGMAYTIAEPCIGTKDTACVDVCPVDCIHPRKDEEEFEAETMLYIHPDECIDCGACIPACPVEAIFVNEEVPDEWQSFIDINASWFEGK